MVGGIGWVGQNVREPLFREKVGRVGRTEGP